MTVLCITPNPALDRILVVPGFVAGAVGRASAVRVVAGGKGLNVARALRDLGQPARCLAPLGGAFGAMLAGLARADGLALERVAIAGETRVSTIILDGEGGATVVNEPGPRVSGEEWRALIVAAGRWAAGGTTACVCGSLPQGVAGEGLLVLTEALTAVLPGSTPLWVDSSGGALAAVLAAPGDERPRLALKINHVEAASALGRPIADLATAARVARGLVERGFALVAITLGEEGAALAEPRGMWSARAPRITPRNPVGSGDAFLAGLMAAWTRDGDPRVALRLGTACGAANALGEGAGRLRAADVRDLAAQVEITAA